MKIGTVPAELPSCKNVLACLVKDWSQNSDSWRESQYFYNFMPGVSPLQRPGLEKNQIKTFPDWWLEFVRGAKGGTWASRKANRLLWGRGLGWCEGGDTGAAAAMVLRCQPKWWTAPSGAGGWFVRACFGAHKCCCKSQIWDLRVCVYRGRVMYIGMCICVHTYTEGECIVKDTL